VTIAPLSPASSASIAAGEGVSPRAPQNGVQAESVSSLGAPPEVGLLGEPALAVDAAIQTAASRQGGLASLLADLEIALQAPGLPVPVLAAGAQVLGLRLSIDPAPTAAELRQAMARSGLFLEAQLASGEITPGPNLKTALLSLGQALEAWMDGASVRSEPMPPPPAPPYRGGPLRGQPPVPARLSPDAPLDAVGARLVQLTARALARQVLVQAASLPSGPRLADPTQAEGQQWVFEVPLTSPQGNAVAQFEIARDGGRAGLDDDHQPVWRAGFSLHLEPTGPVQGRIVLSGDRVRVTLWAEHHETADRLATRSGELSLALQDDELVASVSVIAGAPSVAATPAGRLVNRAL